MSYSILVDINKFIEFSPVCMKEFLFSLSSTENNLTFSYLPLWFMNIFILLWFILINEVKGFCHISAIYIYLSIMNFISFALCCWVINEVFVILRKLDFDLCLLSIFSPTSSFFYLCWTFLPHRSLTFLCGQTFPPFPFWFWLGIKFIFLTTVHCCLPCN